LLQLRLGLSFANIVRENAAQAKGLLRAMIQSEAKALSDIITLNGLVGGRGGQKPPALAERLANELADGAALDKATGKSLQLFKKRVFAVLAEGDSSELGASELMERLGAATTWWRGRLRTIANTVLYAAAAQLRRTVNEYLWRGASQASGF